MKKLSFCLRNLKIWELIEQDITAGKNMWNYSDIWRCRRRTPPRRRSRVFKRIRKLVQAATVIQSHWRGKLARNRLLRLKKHDLERKEKRRLAYEAKLQARSCPCLEWLFRLLMSRPTFDDENAPRRQCIGPNEKWLLCIMFVRVLRLALPSSAQLLVACCRRNHARVLCMQFHGSRTTCSRSLKWSSI